MTLARTVSPLKLSSPLSSSSTKHTSPKFNYKKTNWDIFQSYIAEHLPSLDFDALNIHQAAHSSSLFLVEAAKASIHFGRLGRSPQSLVVPGSGICSSGTTGGPLRGTPILSRTASGYIDASRRASSVISRAKSATCQATCSNLSPRSDPRAVFRLLNAISGKKNTSQNSSFPDCTCPLDTANHFASYLRSRLSQVTLVPRAELNDSS